MWYSWLAKYARAGALLDLSPYLCEWKHLDDFGPAEGRMSQFIDGKWYILAQDFFIQNTHYRRDWLDQANCPTPRELAREGKWDFTAFTQVARTLHNPAKPRYGVAFRGGVGAELTIFNLMVSETGGKFFDSAGKCLLNSIDAMRALEWYGSLYSHDGVTQPSAISDTYPAFVDLFYQHQAGMMIHNDDGVKALLYLGPEQYDVAPLPSDTGRRYLVLAGFGTAVFAGSKNPEWATRLAFQWISPEWIYDWPLRDYRARGLPPVVHNALPFQSLWRRPEVQNPIYQTIYDIPFHHPERLIIPPYELEAYSQIISRLVVPDFQRLLQGKLDVPTLANRWAEAFERATQSKR
jgi:multiple sugar transport system substrate-binding protein